LKLLEMAGFGRGQVLNRDQIPLPIRQFLPDRAWTCGVWRDFGSESRTRLAQGRTIEIVGESDFVKLLADR
jgi:hypothetical protein